MVFFEKSSSRTDRISENFMMLEFGLAVRIAMTTRLIVVQDKSSAKAALKFVTAIDSDCGEIVVITLASC